jgi:hypothetical protein
LSDVIKSIVHHTKKYEEEIILRGKKDRVDRSREMEILSVETFDLNETNGSLKVSEGDNTKNSKMIRFLQGYHTSRGVVQ